MIYLADYLVSIVAMRLLLPLVPDVGSLALTVTFTTVLGAMLMWYTLLRTPLRFLYRRPATLHLTPPRVSSRTLSPLEYAGSSVPTASIGT